MGRPQVIFSTPHPNAPIVPNPPPPPLPFSRPAPSDPGTPPPQDPLHTHLLGPAFLPHGIPSPHTPSDPGAPPPRDPPKHTFWALRSSRLGSSSSVSR